MVALDLPGHGRSDHLPVGGGHHFVDWVPVVLAAEQIILHITGREKSDVLADAARKGLPIAAITDQDRNPVSIWWAP